MKQVLNENSPSQTICQVITKEGTERGKIRTNFAIKFINSHNTSIILSLSNK